MIDQASTTAHEGERPPSFEHVLDEILLDRARTIAHRELRLRSAIGDDIADDVDREEHLAGVRRLLDGVTYL